MEPYDQTIVTGREFNSREDETNDDDFVPEGELNITALSNDVASILD